MARMQQSTFGIMPPEITPVSYSALASLTVSQAHDLYESGVISGGMIPKVDCCIRAVEQGVKNVVIMDGRVPHSILMELLTNEGAGTWIKGE